MSTSEIVRIRVQIESALLGGNAHAAQTLMHQAFLSADDGARAELRRLDNWMLEDGMRIPLQVASARARA